jgi:thymidylate synthase
MRVIYADNVNDAFYHGVNALIRDGVRQSSRAGYVLVMPYPVCTTYAFPEKRVLFHAKRDANPFFHLFEALWMLAGQKHGAWLDQFVHDFSERFAEENGDIHGAYGFRWLRHFDVDGGGEDRRLPNQLDTIVELLKKDPNDRRIVLSMWDPVADLGVSKFDIPCNTHVYFRVREEEFKPGGFFEESDHKTGGRLLDMTVCCRSNDAVWGAYGANAVHFSILQEYLAARIGVQIGTYYQFSNNFHIYSDMVDKLSPLEPENRDFYSTGTATRIVTVPEDFDAELALFMGGHPLRWTYSYRNEFFPKVTLPLLEAHGLWKQKLRKEAHATLQKLPFGSDWRFAAERWMLRRMHKVGE